MKEELARLPPLPFLAAQSVPAREALFKENWRNGKRPRSSPRQSLPMSTGFVAARIGSRELGPQELTR